MPELPDIVSYKVAGRGALLTFEFAHGALMLTEAEFVARLRSEDHPLKRTLTDPRLSPLKLTSRFSEEEAARLHDATVATLTWWIAHRCSGSVMRITRPTTARDASLDMGG